MLDIDIDKISRTLIQPIKELTLKIHIKLLQEKEGRKENFHHLFNFDGNKYLKLDLQSFLTLEMNDGEWARDKSILIDQKNIYHIIKGFETMIESIYNGGVFAVNKSGEVVIFSDKIQEHTVKLFNIGNNQKLILKPAKIFDENEVSYEGVVIFFNKTDNFVQLPIDAFESLYYTLKQTNIFVYSQLLLNYYMSCIKDEKIELKEVVSKSQAKTPKKQHPLFVEQKEEVKSSVFKKDSDEEFFNFNNGGNKDAGVQQEEKPE